MNRNNGTRWIATCLVGAALVLVTGSVLAQEPTLDDRIAALKGSMTASQKALKAYEWTETTVVTYDGEQKSSDLAKCYYGDDGKVVKEPMGEPKEHKKKRGLRGRMAENKMEDLKKYMGSAKTLIGTYVPPNTDKIQKCKDAGKISVELVEPGKRAILRLKDYNLPGDSVGIEVNLVTNTITGYKVATYLDSADEVVTLDVEYEHLDDATIYPALVTLDAKAKGMRVDVSNTDYRHAAK